MKKISLILAAIILMSTLTACKSSKGTLSDNSIIENENSSYFSSDITTTVTENQDSSFFEKTESSDNSSVTSVPQKPESSTSVSKIAPSENNSSTVSSNNNQATDKDANNSSTNSNSSEKTESKPENKIETRIYKNDVFSIEVPVSLYGKYTLNYYDMEKGNYCYIRLAVENADYSDYLGAHLQFIVVNYENDEDWGNKISANSCGCF